MTRATANHRRSMQESSIYRADHSMGAYSPSAVAYGTAGAVILSPLLIGACIGALIAGKGKRIQGAAIGASVPLVIAAIKI